MDVLSIGLQLAFAAVFVIVVHRYLDDRRPVQRDLLVVVGAIVGWFVLATVSALVPSLAPWPSRVGGALLLAVPLLTLRLVSNFSPVRREFVAAAGAWWAVAVIVLLGVGVRENFAATVVVVGYFTVFETAAALLFARGAQDRIGYAQLRLQVAAVATLMLSLTVLVSGINAAGTPEGARLNPELTAASRILALLAGIGYVAAFLPPGPVRRLQQRAIAFDLGQHLVVADTDGDPDAVWRALARSAMQVTGATAAFVALGRPPVVHAVDGTLPAGVAPGTSVPADVLAGAADGHRAYEVPIGAGGAATGTLTVIVPGDWLFVDDDLILLRLLADQAARTAEGQQAIRERGALESELADASIELAESRARLEGEARFRVALEAHPGMILVVDPDGRIGYANEQALRTLGYTPAEMAEVQLRDLLDLGQATDEHTRGVVPVQARRRDGTVIPVDYAASAFESGGIRYSIAVLTDITDRLQSERLRDTFIGMLSHELRTPVTAIYGGSQLLLDRGDRLDTDTRRELIADVASEAERLHRLIENLLVMARVERGQDLAGGEPVLLQRILPVIVDRERLLWPAADIRMTVPPGLPTVRGHDGYVGQVVRNLVSNAAKYGGPGAVVEIRAELSGNGVTVRVLDSGSGLSSEHADKLFDLYYRAPGAAERAPGAGIGLFVCRHIVTALGGTIWARARPDGGAEFGFELPIYEPEDEDYRTADDLEETAAVS